MAILVTGSRGGFAKAFIPRLSSIQVDDVIRVVRDDVQLANEVKCDLSDRASVEALIRKTKPETIYHLAGSFAGNFETDILINALSAKWIFDEIIRLRLDCRVIVFGSAAEYGFVSDQDNPVPETHPLDPVSVYGLTKVIQTQISSYYATVEGLDVVMARVFNLAVEGLSERLFYGRLTSLINAYRCGQINNMSFGNLEAIRDYVDLDKATTQITAIARNGIKGEVYNVGSGVPIRMRDLLCKLLVENNIPLDRFTSVPVLEKRRVDVPKIYADITKVSALK